MPTIQQIENALWLATTPAEILKVLSSVTAAQKPLVSPHAYATAIYNLSGYEAIDKVAATNAVRPFMESVGKYLQGGHLAEVMNNFSASKNFKALDAIADNVSKAQLADVQQYTFTQEFKLVLLNNDLEKVAKVSGDLEVIARNTSNFLSNLTSQQLDQLTQLHKEDGFDLDKYGFQWGNQLNNTLKSVTADASKVEILFGLGGNDTLHGDNGIDFLYGGIGNDTLKGNAGNDKLFGESGNDVLDGGAGADVMYGGEGNDTYYVDNAGDVVIEYQNQGVDTVISSVSFHGLTETLQLSIENITLTGSAESADGSNLANIIIGNAVDNTIFGHDRNDTINGGAGNDTLRGDSGNDILDGGDGDDFLYGASHHTAIVHAVDNDTLRGGAGNDRLEGEGGNDILDGGTGTDLMFGGTGNDTYYVDNDLDVVIEAASHVGVDTVISSVSFAGNTEALQNSLENITLVGSAFSVNGSELNNIIIGNSFYNYMIGAAGADKIYGGGGNDKIYGGYGFLTDWVPVSDNDVLYGDDGDDEIHGEHGTDILYGGTGNDTLYGGTGNDVLYGDAGADKMYGGSGDDDYIVDNANDVVVEYNDQGYDRVFSSVDYLAGAGVEHVILTGSAQIARGNDLNNSVQGNDANNYLFGGAGNDYLEGNAGNDLIFGDAGEDRMHGDDGNDTLYGMQGKDILLGNLGTDTLSGGSEADRFVFSQRDVGTGVDRITDFDKSAGDILDLADIFSTTSFKEVQSAINNFVFATTKGTDTVISVDFDGTGTAFGKVDVAVLSNVTNVSISDWFASGTIDVKID